MNEPTINKKSNWRALAVAYEQLAGGGIESVSDAVFAAIADRLREAIESSEYENVKSATFILDEFYRDLAAAAPVNVRNASRGKGDSELLSAYALGKAAFAQLVAARVASTRVDARFIEHLTDRRYLNVLKALGRSSLSVGDITDRVEERIETVSRKLGALRMQGIVTSRKQGNVVVNSLSPAALSTLKFLNLIPEEDRVALGNDLDAEAREALKDKREKLLPHLRAPVQFKRSQPLLKSVA